MFLKSLKQHYTAYVSKEVDKLSNLMKIEYQLDDAFENNTYDAVWYLIYLFFKNV